MPNPICFCYSMDNFLSERGNKPITYVEFVCLCTFSTFTVDVNFQIRMKCLTVLRLCRMSAANRRLASPRTPAWSLASHHSMTLPSSVASLPSTRAASSDTQSIAGNGRQTFEDINRKGVKPKTKKEIWPQDETEVIVKPQ